MRRRIILALFAIGVLEVAGCLPVNQYCSDPNVRMSQLLNQSEDLRQMQGEFRRFWLNDQPSHLTPERLHGGIVQ